MRPAAASSGSEPFHRRYEGSTSTVNGVRLDVDAWLIDQVADDDTRERAALVVSELASNAVQASPGRPFALTVHRPRSDRITIVVTNHAVDAQIPSRSQWGPEDVLAPGGRGLAIVDALCDVVEIETDEQGTVTVVAALAAGFG